MKNKSSRVSGSGGPARGRRHGRHFWLLKTEPACFSYDDLVKSPGRTTAWTGVRNFQARNFLRDAMKLGDGVLFYHSSINPAGIVGTAAVVREAYPDPTAWERSDEHFDPRSTPESPVWYAVDVRACARFRDFVALPDLRHVRALGKMELLRRGSRLSVQPVTRREWDAMLAMGKGEPVAVADGVAPKMRTRIL